ncbi:MAG: hypothetical protein HGA55_08245, partial [Methanoregulaceae archaeon]|nr:hypothetical protein [Methanoregulaceae archaeon]
SIFEFFGVAVISLFLVAVGLVTARSALRVAYFTAILTFLSGIPGTAHPATLSSHGKTPPHFTVMRISICLQKRSDPERKNEKHSDPRGATA